LLNIPRARFYPIIDTSNSQLRHFSKLPQHLAIAMQTVDHFTIPLIVQLIWYCNEIGIQQVTLYDPDGRLQVSIEEISNHLSSMQSSAIQNPDLAPKMSNCSLIIRGRDNLTDELSNSLYVIQDGLVKLINSEDVNIIENGNQYNKFTQSKISTLNDKPDSINDAVSSSLSSTDASSTDSSPSLNSRHSTTESNSSSSSSSLLLSEQSPPRSLLSKYETHLHSKRKRGTESSPSSTSSPFTPSQITIPRSKLFVINVLSSHNSLHEYVRAARHFCSHSLPRAPSSLYQGCLSLIASKEPEHYLAALERISQLPDPYALHEWIRKSQPLQSISIEDPELLIVASNVRTLLGFPAWLLRCAEIIFIKPNTFSDSGPREFCELIAHYSRTQQRMGT